MIKPDAVGENNTGAIIKMIEEAGFRIVALKKTLLTPERAGEFTLCTRSVHFTEICVNTCRREPLFP